jgi:hypothetical protein
MATSKSAIAIAIARKFPGPAGRRNLLRKLGLGLDDLVAPSAGTAQPDVDGTKTRMADFKVELSQWLSDHAASLPEVDGGGIIGRILALLDQDVGGEDEGGDQIARVRAFLKSRNLSDEDSDEILRLARAVDPAEAADKLPISGPLGLGGRLSDRSRAPGEVPFAGRQAADEATRSRVDADLDRMFGTARVSIGLDYGGLKRPRPAVPVLPTTAAAADSFEKLFPDAGRIGV